MHFVKIEKEISDFKWRRLNTWPWLMLGFRPFFWLAGAYACISIFIFSLFLLGHIQWSLPLPYSHWHAHEMVFGFAGAAAIGFLLTASSNWVGQPTLHGLPLLLLTSLWFFGRVAFFISADTLLPALIIQSIYWLFCSAYLGYILCKFNRHQQLIFVPLLMAIGAFNGHFLYLHEFEQAHLSSIFLYMGVLGFMLIINVLAPRLIPFFTAKGLQKDQKKSAPSFNLFLMLCSVLGLLCFFAYHVLSLPLNPGFILLFVGALNVCRSIYWFELNVIRVPLLWSLHLAYFFMSLGLIGLGLSYFYSYWSFKDALHLITIGAMGLMILSIMSRVSLGHTARPLIVHPLINIAFFCCALSALIRSVMPLFITPYSAWLASGVLWICTFLIFTVIYTPILFQKRLDGRRG